MNAESDRGFAPLHLASFNVHLTMVEALIMSGADNDDRFTPLNVGPFKGHL